MQLYLYLAEYLQNRDRLSEYGIFQNSCCEGSVYLINMVKRVIGTVAEKVCMHSKNSI